MSDKAQEPKHPGIDPCFDEVVDRFGRELFALVMNAGMAGQAAEALGALATRLNQGSVISRQNAQTIGHATGVLATGFNECSNQLVAKMGWVQEDLIACQQAIQLAYASKLTVVEAPKIILH